MALADNLEALLARGQDNALLRFGLGQEYVKLGRFDQAVEQLQKCLAHDPNYSAAWKLLGKALAESGRTDAAIQAFENGIRVAEAKGDIQAAKEMRVFQKRLLR